MAESHLMTKGRRAISAGKLDGRNASAQVQLSDS